MSKGSQPRPMPDKEKYEDNWDRIFGNKEDTKQEEEK